MEESFGLEILAGGKKLEGEIQFGLRAQLRESPELAIALLRPVWLSCWALPSAMTMLPALT